MSFIVDHRQVTNWAKRKKADPQRLDHEMVRTTNAVAGRGIEYAVDFVPRKDGNLAASIGVIRYAGFGSWHAAFGTRGIEYAWIREKGGVIRARNKKYLHFKVNGQWVKVKSVRQKGSHYMRRAHRRLWPEARLAWSMAINRALKGA